VNVVGRFAATGMLLSRRTKNLRYRHLWVRKDQTHGDDQKPSCQLEATIHWAQAKPKSPPVK